MKKSLVLAMAMALGVTASAYAANPFSDVPAGHWAYDSVAKLAAAGVVDGYGDTTFGGDKLMTRYEMAQIVAKAMAKGANVDKLAAEFADELDTLGVRVANLEKKADNVKITGNIRYNYASYSGDLSDEDGNKLRSRIFINGQINDDWSYTGMIENIENFRNNVSEESKTDFQRAYLTGKVGGLKVVAGRQNLTLVDGNLYDTRADGIVASYGKDVKVTAFAAKPTNQVKDLVEKFTVEYDKVYGAKVDAKLGAVAANAGYTVFKDGAFKYDNAVIDDTIDDNKVWNVGVKFDLAKDLNLTADYLRATNYKIKIANDYELDRDGYVVGLAYKGAKAAKAGSYGVYAKYYDQGRATVVAHTMNGIYGTTGFKGYMVGANYAFAKNIVGAVEWYDLESKENTALTPKTDMKTLWSQLIFTF